MRNLQIGSFYRCVIAHWHKGSIFFFHFFRIFHIKLDFIKNNFSKKNYKKNFILGLFEIQKFQQKNKKNLKDIRGCDVKLY